MSAPPTLLRQMRTSLTALKDTMETKAKRHWRAAERARTGRASRNQEVPSELEPAHRAAWEALSKTTGREHAHLALPKEDEKIRFRDVVAQPRKIISAPTWSGPTPPRSSRASRSR